MSCWDRQRNYLFEKRRPTRDCDCTWYGQSHFCPSDSSMDLKLFMDVALESFIILNRPKQDIYLHWSEDPEDKIFRAAPGKNGSELFTWHLIVTVNGVNPIPIVRKKRLKVKLGKHSFFFFLSIRHFCSIKIQVHCHIDETDISLTTQC